MSAGLGSERVIAEKRRRLVSFLKCRCRESVGKPEDRGGGCRRVGGSAVLKGTRATVEVLHHFFS